MSDALATELDSFTTGTVTRLAGANRYATAARVATTTFTAPIAQVLIATGADCPCPGRPWRPCQWPADVGDQRRALRSQPCVVDRRAPPNASGSPQRRPLLLSMRRNSGAP